MIDVATNQPLKVETSLSGLPSVPVSVRQLDALSALLTRHGIPHWDSGGRYALDGVTFFTRMLFGHKGDPVKIQAILDTA